MTLSVSSLRLVLISLFGLATCFTVCAQTPSTKPKITKLDDLPRHTYPVQGNVMDIVTSADKFAPLAAAVRANMEKDLNDYDIEDKTTLKGLKSTLLKLDLLEGKNDEARKLIAELRDLEDKPALKLTTGFLAETRLDAQDQTKQTDLSNPAFQAAFTKELTARANALPWNIVQDELKHMKGGFEMLSKNLLIGEVQSELEPAVKQTGSLSDEMASAVIGIRSSLLVSVPIKPAVVAALTEVIQPHSVAKADIWQNRAVVFTEDQKLTPVVVAIWDSGVDAKVYPGNLFNNPRVIQFILGTFFLAGVFFTFVVGGLRLSKHPGFLKLAFRSIGMGVISAAIGGGIFIVLIPGKLVPLDLHGLAFDLHSNRVHGELYPVGDNAKRLPELKSQIKGILDMQAAIDSPEAAALKKKMSTLTPEQVKPFMEDLELFSNYIHGTHVAGIATEGNPFARILIARLTFDYHVIPEKPTVEQAKKDVIADQAYVDYFKQHGVRVVNMSWGGSLKDVEGALAQNGVGDAEERKKQAREIFDIGKDGLYKALQGAPDILFIASAGNSDNDVDFAEMVPSSFELPNFVTVGAVDQAGDETSFTSFGKNVIAYADGFEVESYIPGGTRLKLSGTSMASPEVTNLAAKLFAMDPTLKPTDVIDLIKGGLEPSSTNPKILLLNPKKSVELLKARMVDKNEVRKD